MVLPQANYKTVLFSTEGLGLCNSNIGHNFDNLISLIFTDDQYNKQAMQLTTPVTLFVYSVFIATRMHSLLCSSISFRKFL